MSSTEVQSPTKDSELDIELRKTSFSTLSSSGSEEDHFLLDEELSAERFPPVDRGAGAWKFLLGCWLIEAVLWGVYLLILASPCRLFLGSSSFQTFLTFP